MLLEKVKKELDFQIVLLKYDDNVDNSLNEIIHIEGNDEGSYDWGEEGISYSEWGMYIKPEVAKKNNLKIGDIILVADTKGEILIFELYTRIMKSASAKQYNSAFNVVMSNDIEDYKLTFTNEYVYQYSNLNHTH